MAKPSTARPKVFCIGFQKTGTTSLYAALEQLGYKTAAVVGRDWRAERLAAEGAGACIDTARDFDAAQDMPWPIFFRELDEAFPGSKFILTVRDPESWFASIEGHFGANEGEMQAFVYGRDAAAPAGNKARYLETLRRHEAAVRAHFAGRPDDLLVMNLEAGDGWPELCAFLGASPPADPFPARNKAADRKTLSFRIRRKVGQLFGRYLAPERI
ncbi:MAG: sulfotransferase [Parvularculaceae bacterium]|nr:sulfotransferase [Parvularculaceae bacterium]